MRLRRRIRDLEARIEALEQARPVDYTMPPRPDIDSEPIEVEALWRERCADYGQVRMEDIEDDRARTGVYL